MTKLRMIVQETGVSLFVVSHLKRPDGKGHEEGAATSLNQLRGSGSIGQLADMGSLSLKWKNLLWIGVFIRWSKRELDLGPM